MDELKELLFKSTLNHRRSADEEMSQYQGQIDYYLQKSAHLQRFCALYTLIEQAGLEEEYQAWKATQNERRYQHDKGIDLPGEHDGV